MVSDYKIVACQGVAKVLLGLRQNMRNDDWYCGSTLSSDGECFGNIDAVKGYLWPSHSHLAGSEGESTQDRTSYHQSVSSKGRN